MKTAIDLTGQSFGRLAVISRLANDSRGRSRWVAECECGRLSEIRGDNLTSGRTRSCGCLVREITAAIGHERTVHGHARKGTCSRTYKSWRMAKTRCTNPNAINFDHYGGRGISVCSRWLDSFENFLADMGERPEGRSIDRKDNDGNYEPSNCRWATPKEQQANRRNSKSQESLNANTT